MSKQHLFHVEGMTCGHCERSITKAIQQLDSQAAIRIDRANGRVEISSAKEPTLLASAIAEEGYKVTAQ